MTIGDQPNPSSTPTEVQVEEIGVEDFKSRLKEVQLEKLEVEDELATLQSRILRVENEKVALTTQFSEEKKRDDRKLSELERELNELKRKNVEAISEWNKYEECVVSQEKDLKALRDERETLLKGLDESREFDIERQREIEALRSVNATNQSIGLERQLKSKELEELKVKCITLEEELTRTDQALTVAIHDNDQRSEAVREQNTRLEARVKQLEKELEKELEMNKGVEEVDALKKQIEEEREENAIALKKLKEEAQSKADQMTIINSESERKAQQQLKQIEDGWRKEKAEVLALTNAKRKLESDTKAESDAAKRLIEELKKKACDAQYKLEKKMQDEWDETDKHAKAINDTIEASRVEIRNEFMKRINKLEDKLHTVEERENNIKAQLATAQRDAATSKRKAKKKQTTVNERILTGSAPSSDIKMRNKMDLIPVYAFFAGGAIALGILVLFFPHIMDDMKFA